LVYKLAWNKLLKDRPSHRLVFILVVAISAGLASECAWWVFRAPSALGKAWIPDFWLRELTGGIFVGVVVGLVAALWSARLNAILRPYLREQIDGNQGSSQGIA
jgi:H+/Cl- antiporter ClcA